MDEIKFLKGVLEMEYTRSPGKTLGRFLSELRDSTDILGIRDSITSEVFVPPQQYGPTSHVKMQTFVPVPKEGAIAYFTVVKEKNPFHNWDPPYAYVGVKFDGTHSVFWHRMKEIEGLKAGVKVRPIFKEEEKRSGSILDIEYFEIVK